MGDILLNFYKTTKEQGGIEAQIKLALITKISSIKARTLNDSEENIRIFEDAMSKIFPGHKRH